MIWGPSWILILILIVILGPYSDPDPSDAQYWSWSWPWCSSWSEVLILFLILIWSQHTDLRSSWLSWSWSWYDILILTWSWGPYPDPYPDPDSHMRSWSLWYPYFDINSDPALDHDLRSWSSSWSWLRYWHFPDSHPDLDPYPYPDLRPRYQRCQSLAFWAILSVCTKTQWI